MPIGTCMSHWHKKYFKPKKPVMESQKNSDPLVNITVEIDQIYSL